VCQSANRLNPMKLKGKEEVAGRCQGDEGGSCSDTLIINKYSKLRYSRPDYDVYYDDSIGS
jgi:hypothetical protein